MKRLQVFLPFVLALAALALMTAACGGEAENVEVTRLVAVANSTEAPASESERAAAATPAGTRMPAGNNGRTDVAARQERLIIKDAEMELLVDDADRQAETATGIVVDSGGYVINQRIWTAEQGFRYADLQFGVPVSEFEAILAAFRTLGVVVDEVASGTDVTDEFVDLNSQLENLQATRDRLRSFLDAAETISETLAVDEELRQVEEEINVIQGRIGFLADRAAFSTITVRLRPEIPTPTPTPTAPPPTPESWTPGDTAERAQTVLINTSQGVADGLIYLTIVCGPWLLIAAVLGFIGWQIRRAVRRRRPGSAPLRARRERSTDKPDGDASA